MVAEFETKIQGCCCALLFANWNFHKRSVYDSFQGTHFPSTSRLLSSSVHEKLTLAIEARSSSHCPSNFPVKLPATRSNIDLRLWSTRYNQMNCVLKADSLDSKIALTLVPSVCPSAPSGQVVSSPLWNSRINTSYLTNTDFKGKFAQNNIYTLPQYYVLCHDMPFCFFFTIKEMQRIVITVSYISYYVSNIQDLFLHLPVCVHCAQQKNSLHFSGIRNQKATTVYNLLQIKFSFHRGWLH